MLLCYCCCIGLLKRRRAANTGCYNSRYSKYFSAAGFPLRLTSHRLRLASRWHSVNRTIKGRNNIRHELNKWTSLSSVSNTTMQFAVNWEPTWVLDGFNRPLRGHSKTNHITEWGDKKLMQPPVYIGVAMRMIGIHPSEQGNQENACSSELLERLVKRDSLKIGEGFSFSRSFTDLFCAHQN